MNVWTTFWDRVTGHEAADHTATIEFLGKQLEVARKRNDQLQRIIDDQDMRIAALQGTLRVIHTPKKSAKKGKK